MTERIPPDAPLERRRTDRRQAAGPARRAIVRTPELRNQQPGPTAPALPPGQELHVEVEGVNPYWTTRGSTELARVIHGVCGVTSQASEQLTGEAIDSDAGVIFETETRVAGRARLGIKKHRWLAVRRHELGREFRLEKLS